MVLTRQRLPRYGNLMHYYTQHESTLCIQTMIKQLIYLSFYNPPIQPLPSAPHTHIPPLAFFQSTTNGHLTSARTLMSSEVAPASLSAAPLPPLFGCRSQKHPSPLSPSSRLMSIVGKATQTTWTHGFVSVCISGANQGRMDDGWVEMLVVVRCLLANIVDKVRTNLGKNKGG